MYKVHWQKAIQLGKSAEHFVSLEHFPCKTSPGKMGQFPLSMQWISKLLKQPFARDTGWSWIQARIQNLSSLAHVRVNLVKEDRNTINCSTLDYPNCPVIFLKLLFPIFWFFPVRINAHFSSWNSCNCKSSFALPFAFALFLSQKTNPAHKSVVFTHVEHCQRLLNFEVLKMAKTWKGEVKFIAVAKQFVDWQKEQRTSWENEGKIIEIRVGICCHLPRTSKHRISCTQLFVWFVILPGMAATTKGLKWRGKKLWSGCLQNNLPIRGVSL